MIVTVYFKDLKNESEVIEDVDEIREISNINNDIPISNMLFIFSKKKIRILYKDHIENIQITV